MIARKQSHAILGYYKVSCELLKRMSTNNVAKRSFVVCMKGRESGDGLEKGRRKYLRLRAVDDVQARYMEEAERDDLDDSCRGVDVWVMERSACASEEVLKGYEKLLSEKEKRSIRIDALREESRNERLQTRALVRTVLAKYVGSRTPPEELEFTYNEKGKPFLREEFNRDRMIQFSVSHSENLIAMAVATDGRRVGVDCEVEERRTKESCAKLAKRYFSKSAYERINSALENDEDDGRRMFVKYWCLCESYVKALGVGISGRPFKYFDIKQTKSSEIKLEETNVEECGKWAFELFRENRTKSIVAVCAEDADKKRARKLPIVASFRHIKPLLDEEDAYEELLSNRRTSKHSNDLEILGH